MSGKFERRLSVSPSVPMYSASHKSYCDDNTTLEYQATTIIRFYEDEREEGDLNVGGAQRITLMKDIPNFREVHWNLDDIYSVDNPELFTKNETKTTIVYNWADQNNSPIMTESNYFRNYTEDIKKFGEYLDNLIKIPIFNMKLLTSSKLRLILPYLGFGEAFFGENQRVYTYFLEKELEDLALCIKSGLK